MANPDMFGPATLVATQGITLFQGLLPKLTEIRQQDPKQDPEFAADVHLGEAASCGILIGVAVIASTFAGSWLPLIVALGMSALLVTVYESVLNGRPFSRQAWEASAS